MGHKWTYEEDLACARAYVEFIMDKDPRKNIRMMIYKLSRILPQISQGSIRMKIQNLKAISNDNNFDDGIDLAPLSQYSFQSQCAYRKAMKEGLGKR